MSALLLGFAAFVGGLVGAYLAIIKLAGPHHPDIPPELGSRWP